MQLGQTMSGQGSSELACSRTRFISPLTLQTTTASRHGLAPPNDLRKEKKHGQLSQHMKLRLDNLPPGLQSQRETLTRCLEAMNRALPVREVYLFGSSALIGSPLVQNMNVTCPNRLAPGRRYRAGCCK